MKYAKYNKYEKKAVRAANIAAAMSGSGLYVYENSSAHADLTLPRPTHSGVRKIGPRGTPSSQFQGDDYYMQLVKTGMLRLIKVIQTPEEEAAALEQQEREQAQEALEEEQTLMEETKLIVDQPDRVTNKGKVEHVVQKGTSKRKLNESGNQPQPDVLLNEGPGGDGFVIVTE